MFEACQYLSSSRVLHQGLPCIISKTRLFWDPIAVLGLGGWTPLTSYESLGACASPISVQVLGFATDDLWDGSSCMMKLRKTGVLPNPGRRCFSHVSSTCGTRSSCHHVTNTTCQSARGGLGVCPDPPPRRPRRQLLRRRQRWRQPQPPTRIQARWSQSM